MKIEFTVEDYFNELQSMENIMGRKKNCIHGFTCYYRWLRLGKKIY